MSKKHLLTPLLMILLSIAMIGCSTTSNASKTNDTNAENAVKSSKTTKSSLYKNKKVLVAYYSATGTTKGAAQKIASATSGTFFTITPKKPYTDDDLDYSNNASRVVKEYRNKNRHVALKVTTPKQFKKYDVIFIGYPIWWGNASWVVNDFVKKNNFKNKTVMPFSTSVSSGLGNSGTNLKKMSNGGTWLKGRDLSNASSSDIKKWVNGLKIA